MAKVRIKYIIPEDGDEIDHPNVFTLQSSSSTVTLRDIKKSFPLSNNGSSSEFHFRFLKLLSPENKVWLDLINDSDVLPSVNGSIFAKVSRISSSSTSNTAAINNNVASPNINKISKSTNVPPPSTTPSNSTPKVHHEANLLGVDDNFHSNNSTTNGNGSASGGPFNLLDTSDFDTNHKNAKNDLLDMTSSSSNPPVDLFGSTFTTSSPLSMSTGPTGTGTLGKSVSQKQPVMNTNNNGLKNSISVDRGIDNISNNISPQNQPPSTIRASIQQQPTKNQSPPQAMRGQVHDPFGGIGDFGLKK